MGAGSTNVDAISTVKQMSVTAIETPDAGVNVSLPAVVN